MSFICTLALRGSKRLQKRNVQCSAERAFCPELASLSSEALLSAEESQHLRSRRINVGEELELFDGRGSIARAELTSFKGRVARVRVVESRSARRPDTSVTAAVAIPKGARADWMIEKLTEVGVETIIPLITERSSLQIKDTRVDRWTRVAVAACKQSLRDVLPTFSQPETLADLTFRISTGTWSRVIMASFDGASLDTLPAKTSSSVLFVVGPEGGFTEAEISNLRRYGVESVLLGMNRLRVETAAIVMASLLLTRHSSASQ
mmetsp:Transcript_160/g.489  ORF Transcript_160/g.489 Transcript_160/m.489 type:complete len:263 (-) Transcript_160:77-865(-)|eukprot:CAMPEP_0198731366 /NCGR_PEP_ID=MMETSP1475-20131203/29341_1 /TAXON_ID= ORGANISM="Unidentified sp., Strain CCMP1999" /NCGR_SAMPLE_ID=MMETSP1475 /ASSEMBLY_ACC=CAM_ASM_001111 /LENGTH=262 /DNA_ID=CAMNT_0044494325 /DNA_START=85 /DNA_END=873 /DNA_ORIENTATION=+